MPTKHRHLQQDRRGRYNARMGVPKELRQIVGKRELIKALGGDRQAAIKALPSVVADFHKKIDSARLELADSKLDHKLTVASEALSPDAIAALHYRQMLNQDAELRKDTPGYDLLLIDDGYVSNLKSIQLEMAPVAKIEQVLGKEIERFRAHGYHDYPAGTAGWRQLAARLALAELEVIRRMFERDEGQFESPTPAWIEDERSIQRSGTVEAGSKAKVKYSILELFEMCRRSKTGTTELTDSSTRALRKPINDFIEFAETDRPEKITNLKISQWIEYLQFERKLAPKTIDSKYLPAIRHTLKWAGNRGYIEPITITASIFVPKKKLDRTKGYTETEASAVLKFALGYQPSKKGRENSKTTAAKRWASWLLYFTGARIGEIMQLRKQDVRTINEIHYIHITPDAGTTKTGLWRDVPLHSQLIEQGFLKFVEKAPEGPLFYRLRSGEQDIVKTAGSVGQNVAKWLKKSDLVPKDVAPNHGFRHTFKTLARRHNIPVDYMHAIQGHATETAGQDYGDVDIETMKREIEKIPRVTLTRANQ